MDFLAACWTRCCAFLGARVRTERGASLVEYALLLGLIAMVCFGAITLLGEKTQVPLSRTSSGLQG